MSKINQTLYGQTSKLQYMPFFSVESTLKVGVSLRNLFIFSCSINCLDSDVKILKLIGKSKYRACVIYRSRNNLWLHLSKFETSDSFAHTPTLNNSRTCQSQPVSSGRERSC